MGSRSSLAAKEYEVPGTFDEAAHASVSEEILLLDVEMVEIEEIAEIEYRQSQ